MTLIQVSRGDDPVDGASGFVPGMSTSIYAALDAIGTMIRFQRAVPNKTGTAILQSLLAIDLDGIGAAMDLFLFDRLIASGGNDNAIWAPSDADLASLIGVVNILAADWVAVDTGGANPTKVAQLRGLSTPILVPETSGNGSMENRASIFGRLVARDTPTFSSTFPLIIKLGLIQE